MRGTLLDVGGRISSITRNARLSEETNRYTLQGDLISRAQQSEYGIYAQDTAHLSEHHADRWSSLGSSGTVHSD